MTSTEQLRQAIATARGDLEAAERAREELRFRRAEMLLTASVEEIIAIEDKAWALGIEIEISQAKIKAFGQKLDHIERERARWVGVDMPTDTELKQLLALIENGYPRLLDRRDSYIVRGVAAEFKSAFYAVGSMRRLAEPTQKVTFSTHIDRVNTLLRSRGHAEVEGDVIMAAVIAWAIPFRLQDLQYGMVAEAALDPYTGQPPSPAAWRGLLDGSAPLPRPLPPRGVVQRVVAQV